MVAAWPGTTVSSSPAPGGNTNHFNSTPAQNDILNAALMGGAGGAAVAGGGVGLGALMGGAAALAAVPAGAAIAVAAVVGSTLFALIKWMSRVNVNVLLEQAKEVLLTQNGQPPEEFVEDYNNAVTRLCRQYADSLTEMLNKATNSADRMMNFAELEASLKRSEDEQKEFVQKRKQLVELHHKLSQVSLDAFFDKTPQVSAVLCENSSKQTQSVASESNNVLKRKRDEEECI